MRVIIPAASTGTRLRPFTDHLPKAAIPVCGKPLIWHSLERLKNAGVEEVVVVCGYRGDQLRKIMTECPERPRLHFVANPAYRTTNSIVSLSLTRDRWNRPFCVVDGDVLVGPSLLRGLLDADGDRLVIDSTRPHADIDMKVEVNDGRIGRFGKDLPPDRCGGEFFGVSRWTPEGGAELSAAIGRRLDRGEDHLWYESAIEDVALVQTLRPIYAAGGDWAEVDSPADLASAERVAGA
jgi:choline kinase